ncbi:ermin [Pseudophryne corroboree]|uniref:ermin n=1 Tax=Pseudophryne corroboree TaxID=495146 RepID=UPI003081C2C9
MAEELQVPEYNGNVQTEIIPVQITDVIDEMDTSVLCETRDCDPVFTSKCTEEPGIHLVDTAVTPIMDVHKEEIEEELKGETGPESISLTECEAQEEGECESILETDSECAPAGTFIDKEDLNEQDKDQQDKDQQDKEQEGVETETPEDILLYNQRKHLADTSAEDMLIETEEENTSIETDNENEDGSYDEQEYRSHSVSPGGSHIESKEDQSVSGNRPDISRHSYSRYDTVSYRKIRRGNTKQRIDEFESMMNL